MEITWHGHSFFELETATGTNLVIDPFTSADGNGLTQTTADDLSPDLVLITHGHGDHFGSTLDIDAPVLAIHEIATFVAANGGQDATGAGGMNIGGTFEFQGNRITMVPAVHSSGCPGKDGPWDGDGGHAAGFIIDDGETRFYDAGDTFLFGDMKTVIADVLEPDIAALPIGDLFTMNPQHAGLAAQWLGVDAAIPIHYDTFDPIKQDPNEFAKAATGVDVHILSGDETLTY